MRVVSHHAYPGYQRVALEGATLRREGFTLSFRGPTHPALPQRMYSLEHETMGKVEMLFLVPVGEDRHGRTYEAVFN